MKKISKIFISLFISALLLISLASCGASYESAYDGDESSASKLLYNKVSDYSDSDSGSGSGENEQKYVITSTVNAKTLDFESKIELLENYVDNVNGYFESYTLSGTDSEDYTTKTLSSKVRVPADKYNDFIDFLNENFDVTYSNQTNENITQSYYEYKSHYDSLKVTEERLVELLKECTTVDEIIKIEDKLSDVRQQITYYETILNGLDNDVDYATINLDIKKVLEEEEEKEETFWTRIADAFVGSWNAFAEFFKGLAVFFVWVFPALLVLSAIAAVVLVIVFANIKKKKKKADKN